MVEQNHRCVKCIPYRLRERSQSMYSIKVDIYEACSNLGITIEELLSEQADDIRFRVSTKFANGVTYWLWSSLSKPHYGIREKGSWKFIEKLNLPSNLILFFNKNDEIAIFTKVSLEGIVKIIDYCAPFEFYITDFDANFLVCYNHHDYLSITSENQLWLEENKDILNNLIK